METYKTHKGHLGIPCPEFLAAPFSLGNLYFHEVYANLLTQEIGRRELEALNGDSRIQKMLGKKVASGLQLTDFSVETLCKWLLWRINNVGACQARAELEDYLNAEDIITIVAIWIGGIDIHQSIDLFDGYKMIPFKEMPESWEKYLFHCPFSLSMSRESLASVALAKEMLVKKIWPKESQFAEINPFEVIDSLTTIAGLMNTIKSFTVFTDESRQYLPDSVPNGLFSTTAGGGGSDDLGNHFVNPLVFSEDNARDLKQLYDAYVELSDAQKSIVNRALQRLSQAKRRNNPEDKVLDLGISLEMILLNNSSTSELKYRFAQRGAFLYSDLPEKRKFANTFLKKLYDGRSSVAHSGELKKLLSNEQIDLLIDLAETLFREIILTCRLGAKDTEWDSLIFGG